jgi:hypothetical protein
VVAGLFSTLPFCPFALYSLPPNGGSNYLDKILSFIKLKQ